MILAGLDIGTLTCRLLIARVSESGGLTELRSDRRIVRLGEGVDHSRTLRLDAMDRVIRTLVEWRKIIETYPVDEQIAVATSAVRDAKNREECLGRGWAIFQVRPLSEPRGRSPRSPRWRNSYQCTNRPASITIG